jgi:putative transposase
MTEYRRACIPGATWFFTVNLAERHGKPLLVDHIDLLRRVFRDVKDRHPFGKQGTDHAFCMSVMPPATKQSDGKDTENTTRRVGRNG